MGKKVRGRGDIREELEEEFFGIYGNKIIIGEILNYVEELVEDKQIKHLWHMVLAEYPNVSPSTRESWDRKVDEVEVLLQEKGIYVKKSSQQRKRKGKRVGVDEAEDILDAIILYKVLYLIQGKIVSEPSLKRIQGREWRDLLDHGLHYITKHELYLYCNENRKIALDRLTPRGGVRFYFHGVPTSFRRLFQNVKMLLDSDIIIALAQYGIRFTPSIHIFIVIYIALCLSPEVYRLVWHRELPKEWVAMESLVLDRKQAASILLYALVRYAKVMVPSRLVAITLEGVERKIRSSYSLPPVYPLLKGVLEGKWMPPMDMKQLISIFPKEVIVMLVGMLIDEIGSVMDIDMKLQYREFVAKWKGSQKVDFLASLEQGKVGRSKL